jgi:hypothetical protein
VKKAPSSMDTWCERDAHSATTQGAETDALNLPSLSPTASLSSYLVNHEGRASLPARYGSVVSTDEPHKLIHGARCETRAEEAVDCRRSIERACGVGCDTEGRTCQVGTQYFPAARSFGDVH